jgi:hypothetical protein
MYFLVFVIDLGVFLPIAASIMSKNTSAIPPTGMSYVTEKTAMLFRYKVLGSLM